MGQVVQLSEHRSQRASRHSNEPLLTKRQLAERLSVCERTIENWQRKGLMPHRFGGCVRYRLSEVEDWFASRPDK